MPTKEDRNTIITIVLRITDNNTESFFSVEAQKLYFIRVEDQGLSRFRRGRTELGTIGRSEVNVCMANSFMNMFL